MTTDVLAIQRTSTGALGVGPTRIRGVYYVGTATAGTITVREGGPSGETRLVLTTPASAAEAGYLRLPDNGIRCYQDPHVTLSNVTAVTVFYG